MTYSNYFFILESAFKSDPGSALIYSLPALLGILMLISFLLGSAIALFKPKEPSNRLEDFTSLSGAVLVTMFTFLALPDMDSIHYRDEYIARIFEIKKNEKMKSLDEEKLFRSFRYGNDGFIKHEKKEYREVYAGMKKKEASQNFYQNFTTCFQNQTPDVSLIARSDNQFKEIDSILETHKKACLARKPVL